MFNRFPTRFLGRVLVSIFALAAGAVQAAQWARTYGTSAAEFGTIYPAAGGGYYLYASKTFTGSGTDTVYGKLTTAGAVSWAKRIGGSKADSLFAEAVADGYLVTGITKSFPAPGVAKDNLLWAKFDLNWNPVYANVFGNAGTDEEGFFLRTAEGGMLFAGSRTTQTQTTTSSDVLILNTRSDGTIKWKKALDYGPEDDLSQALEVSSGYLVAGTLQDTSSASTGILVMKLAKAGGAILWKKLYSLDDSETGTTPFLFGLTPVSGGNFIALGSLQPANPFFGAARLFVAKLDATGNILWSMAYGLSTANLQGLSVTENTVDQTLLVSGSMSVADFMSQNFGNSSLFAMRLNGATGGIGLQKRIGAPSQYNSGSVLKSAGGVVYFTGTHAANLQDVAANPRILYGRLNTTTLVPTWAKTFGGPEANSKEYGSAQKTASGYMLGGTTFSFGAATESKGDIFGMILDANGNYPDCFLEAITLASSNPGIAAAAFPLVASDPVFASKANGNASAAVLPVAATTLPSTDICAPVAN